MVTPYPPQGLTPWDEDLRAYIDGQDQAPVGIYPSRDFSGVLGVADIPTVTTGVAGDGAFNEGYSITGGVLPAVWPVDAYGDMKVISNTWVSVGSVGSGTTPTTFRMMCDGNEFIFMTYALGFVSDIFIDGRPYASNPVTNASSTGFAPLGFQKLVFPSAKPRLIEIRTAGGLSAVYTKKPYRIWKPSPDTAPKIAVVGDSFVLPTTMSDTAAAAYSPGGTEKGIYQSIYRNLGTTSIAADGIGGTGYVNAGSGQVFGHANRLAWLSRVNPDVAIIHSGGAGDLYGGATVSAIATEAAAYFRELRDRLPSAKLVFVEGFAPPLFVPATANPAYISIRQQVQAAISDVDGVYFVDVATSRPPLNGTGYVTATNGSGNSDIYIGSDGVHYTGRGADYLRAFLAPKLKTILNDRGALSGQLI